VLTLGIDGCRAGWLYVARNVEKGDCRAGILTRIDGLLDLVPVPAIVAIDIPIGLLDSGPRLCDLEARKVLGRPRSSSVFPAPVRRILGAATYAEACAVGRAADGRAINRETWNIIPKIREVDGFLRAHPEYRGMVYETHPELCFWRWNGGKGMNHAKRTPQGRAEREALVVSVFGAEVEAARASLPRAGWANDDLLDAFATLWTATRILAGTHVTLPARPPVDRRGLRMEIVS